MADVNQLVERAKANELIAQNLFEIEVEIMNIARCTDFFDQLLLMVHEKFAVEHVWVTIVDVPANEHFIHALEDLESQDHLEHYQKVTMLDFLQATKSTKQPILKNQQLQKWRGLIPKALRDQIASLAMLPIVVEKKVVGALMLGSPNEARYSPDKDHFFLRQLAVKVSLSLIGVWARERVGFLATRDPLTHLRNRREMEEALSQELSRHQRQGADLAVMFIDCDDFKQVNDVYGHEVGDLYLKHVANLLLETTRKSDLVFRFAGDEFVIILPYQAQQGADIIASRIREQVIETPMPYENGSIQAKLSYGVVSTETLAKYDGRSLLKVADEELYKMKALKPKSR